MPIEFSLEVPANFSLAAAVCGHGWYDLAPFQWNSDAQILSYVLRSTGGKSVSNASISDRNGVLNIRVDRVSVGREKAERDIRHILRLDDDMAEFYEVAGSKPGTQWVSSYCAGRLLRSATVFEDLVKTLCTTNCSWGLT